MKFQFTLSPEAIEKQYIATGKCNSLGRLELADESLTPEQRAVYVAAEKALRDAGVRFFGGLPLGDLRVNANSYNVSLGIAEVDDVPTEDTVWSIVERMVSQIDDAVAVLEAAQAKLTAEREAQKAARKERERIMREAAAKHAELARGAAAKRRTEAENIAWDADGKAIIDLRDQLFALSGDAQDSRYNSWAKVVTGITQEHDNGYTFQGDFVNAGTIEIERKSTVFLVASTSGSRKYHTTTYRVIILNAETGKLELTDITTDNDTPGWALRIRDRVKALLS